MTDLESSFSEQTKKMLTSFKKVVDTIIEEEMPLSNYVEIIVDKGIKSILSDIIPKEPEVLWNTIERISESNPEFFAEFVVEVLKKKIPSLPFYHPPPQTKVSSNYGKSETVSCNMR